MRELTLKNAALLEELGHKVTAIDNPVPTQFIDDFLLYWSFLAFALVRGGRRTFGESFDRTRLDNLSLGLEQLRGPQPAQAAAGDRAAVPGTANHRRLTDTYDVVMMPTLAEVTPRIGHLDPTADYQQIIDRLVEWVAFTPLQNATGEPAISLPLAESASGLPIGMMFAAPVGHEAKLLELAYELEEARPWPRIQA